MDRLYTSIPLFEWLLEKKITAIGTLTMNRKGIPEELKSTRDRELNSYKVFWEKDHGKLTLHSYVTSTKSSGSKNVLALSSTPPILGTTKDDGRAKPALLKLYDFSRGGTDIVDQRISSYSSSSKSRRWTHTAFSYMMDTARVNAQCLFALKTEINPRQTSSFLFGFEVVKSLVIPHIMRRKTETLSSAVKAKIAVVLEDSDKPEDVSATPVHHAKRKRCQECVEGIRGSQYKIKRAKLSKISGSCAKCESAMCRSHTVSVCTHCAKKGWRRAPAAEAAAAAAAAAAEAAAAAAEAPPADDIQ